ncbi:hypothetical protein JHK87_047557 [Glycine soja]|nr:hypothetical protein JHK87_047557 [Glycine soja]
MILTLTCITISILWLNIEPVLLFCGQNPTISSIATTYLGFSLPDLIFTSLIISFKIFLRTQDVTLPFMFSATLAPFLHAIINIVVIHTFGLGIQGVALVGNELGANRFDKAKASSFYALLCAFITTIVATILTDSQSALRALQLYIIKVLWQPSKFN